MNVAIKLMVSSSGGGGGLEFLDFQGKKTAACS